MESYLVSARKYRPSTFDSVVGQRALTATLKNAVATGRLAHSYLFCGSRGVGKTSCARIFAKTINCEHRTPEGEACNECESCRAFNAGNSMNIIELDAASNNGIDDIRSLIEQVQIPPSRGRYRVFIVDEVHMLSSAAFNSFLKTLEEPPSYVIFILATTEKHKIIPTILSRCQIYDFHRITIDDMIDHLEYVASKEGITTERAALNVIARKADGAMRDALSIFDQIAASSRGNITYQETLDNLNILDYEYCNRLIEAFLAGNILESWLIYKEIRDHGFDSLFFINSLASYLRDLMVARDPATITLLETGEEARKAIAAMAVKCQPAFLYRAMNLCNEADLNYRTASNKQFLIELTLAKICQLCSPSTNHDGSGEGQLKKIAVSGSPQPEIKPQNVAKDKATTTPPTANRIETPTAPTNPPRKVPTAVPHPHQPVSGASDNRRTAGSPTTLRTPGISVSRLMGGAHSQSKESAAKSGSDAPSHGTLRTGEYTRQQIDEAWGKYIELNPKARILISAMRTATIKESSTPHLWSVEVASAVQQDAMSPHLPQLTQFLRETVGNDMLSLELKIVSRDDDRTTLSDRELVGCMIQENPVLRKFIDDLHLTLN